MPAEGSAALASAAQPAAAALGAPDDAHDGAAARAGNGNGGLQLYGDSPRSGWEGADSELGFPLDDIPRRRAAAAEPAPGAAWCWVQGTRVVSKGCAAPPLDAIPGSVLLPRTLPQSQPSAAPAHTDTRLLAAFNTIAGCTICRICTLHS